jgi:large repetitive protein
VYQVCDMNGSCTEGYIYFEVNPNDTPTIDNKTYILSKNQTLQNYINIDDFDQNIDTNAVKILKSSINGRFSWSPQKYKLYREFLYQPNTNFVGKDSIVLGICDSENACSQTTIYFEVIQNEAPYAVDDFFETTYSTSGSVAKNDFDLDYNLDLASFKLVSDAKKGSLNLDAFGTFYYSANVTRGIDSIKYSVCDNLGLCDTAYLIINIGSPHAPIANDDYVAMPQNTSTIINWSANDSDPDNDLNLKSFVITRLPNNGVASVNLNGNCQYTPNIGFTGTDSLVYRVCDLANNCAKAIIYINVDMVNHAPIAKDSIFTTTMNTPLSNSVKKLVSDVDNNIDTASFTVLNTPKQGTVVMNQFGNFTYTPNTGFVGLDSCYYKVCDRLGLCDTANLIIKVNINEAPKVINTNRINIFMTKNISIINEKYIQLAVSDVNNNLNPNSFSIDTLKSIHGKTTLKPDGTFSYVPDSNFVGKDQFSFKVCDYEGLCTTAIVNITVMDIVVAVENVSKIGKNDYMYAQINTETSFNVTTNDGFTDNISNYTFKFISSAKLGKLTSNSIGDCTYIPNTILGTDTIYYSLKNNASGKTDTATLFVIVYNNDIKDSVITKVFDHYFSTNKNVQLLIPLPKFSSINVKLTTFGCGYIAVHNAVISNHSILDAKGKYVPFYNFTGLDTATLRFEYLKSAGCNNLTQVELHRYFITVNELKNPPITRDTTFTTNINTPLSNSVKKLVSDIDNNLDTASFTLLSNPTRGSMTLNQFGDFTYKPNTNFVGSDSCYYRVCDKTGLCDTAMIIIKVLSNNTALSITAQPLNIEECMSGNASLQVGIAGGTGVVSYQWQQSADGVNFTSIVGATMPSYMPFSTSAGTSFYRCIIKAGTETVTSNSAKVTVNPSISFTSQPINIKLLYKSGTINADSNAVFKAAVMGGSGMMSYQWQCSSNNSTWSNLTDNTTTLGVKTTALTLVKPKISEVPYFHLVASSTGSGCQAATSATGIFDF